MCHNVRVPFQADGCEAGACLRMEARSRRQGDDMTENAILSMNLDRRREPLSESGEKGRCRI